MASGFSRTKTWRMVNISLWITFALWFLPLAHEFAHTPGNLTKLWVFFLAAALTGSPSASPFKPGLAASPASFVQGSSSRGAGSSSAACPCGLRCGRSRRLRC